MTNSLSYQSRHANSRPTERAWDAPILHTHVASEPLFCWNQALWKWIHIRNGLLPSWRSYRKN